MIDKNILPGIFTKGALRTVYVILGTSVILVPTVWGAASFYMKKSQSEENLIKTDVIINNKIDITNNKIDKVIEKLESDGKKQEQLKLTVDSIRRDSKITKMCMTDLASKSLSKEDFVKMIRTMNGLSQKKNLDSTERYAHLLSMTP